jgi:hypothetical protein
MPNYELIAKFYVKHSLAQAHRSSLQPYDFRNQILKQQQAIKPTAQQYQPYSKPYNAFIRASGCANSWRRHKQRVGLVRSCKLSTAAVHKGSLLQPNPAQTLAAIAVPK